MDRIRNENTKGTEHARCFAREARLKWLGRFQTKDRELIDRRMLTMGLADIRPRGRPKRKLMDALKETVQTVGFNGCS